MEIKKIEYNNIEEFIYNCYKLDTKLTNDYCRRRNEGFDACCNDAIKILKDKNTETFGIYDNNTEFVGYFAVAAFPEGKELPAFFIAPNYREIKEEIWLIIKNHFNCTFYNAIYINNIPAINFCKKRGKIITSITYDNEEHVVFEFKGV